MNRNDPPRAALFDLDGTLADTLDDIALSVNAALAAAGLSGHETSTYKRMVGNGFEVLMRRATAGADLDETRFRAVYDDAYGRYRMHQNDHTRPYEGIPELLRGLRARGVTMAVLSNKPDPMTRRMVADLFPGIPFVLVRGDLPGQPRKPDPGGAADLAAQSGIPAADWLYVGDTSVDMETARGAGMRACGVLWGFRDEAELLAAGAEILVSHPSEILAIFPGSR